jgi:hypothetical protein
MAYVDETNDDKFKQLERLLTDNGSGENEYLRLFLVKRHVCEGHGSWTYDPVGVSLDPANWSGAIFITELYNDNDDERYIDLGLQPSNDSLLHELGHVLMQEGTHYNDPGNMNFFHESACMTDDSILPRKALRMCGELLWPNYLVQSDTEIAQ